ncbi:sulfotransferase 1C1 isoform X1 [Anolis carolinensis]|uniref:sulfotransferase 1C1 isoform X1 n=1 Tax=Anolis carolinensis TaxID=28377 RepID=UPI002F2B7C5E
MDTEMVGDSKSTKRPTLGDINGVLFPSDMINGWGPIWNFRARSDDLLICTYPKAGTTWIQEIVDMVQHGGDLQKCARAPIYERIPFIDICLPEFNISGVEKANARASPRTLKSHLPIQLLPPSFWKQKSKIIYVARNVKDNVVSYFHFHRMNKTETEPGTWEEFLEAFIAGKVSCGSWFDHVHGWWEAKDRHPILYLFYEDMKENPGREIQKVADFLDVQLPESVLNQIAQHTKFECMKANPMTNYTTLPSSLLDHTISPFMRKGTVGNWKEHFTVVQSEQLDDLCAQLLKGTGLTFRTEL